MLLRNYYYSLDGDCEIEFFVNKFCVNYNSRLKKVLKYHSFNNV